MSEAAWCRLCLNSCNDYRRIYDETGQCNVELYEVTVKYFQPTILNAVDGDSYTVMCLGCWRHLWEFHKFQNDILLAQERLSAKTGTVQQITVNLKKEAPIFDHTDDLNADIDVKNEMEFLPLSNLELINLNHSLNLLIPNNEPLLPNREVIIDEKEYINAEANNGTNYSSMEEYDDDVGTFIGGEFNNMDESACPSLPDPDTSKLELSSEVETPSTSNVLRRSPQEMVDSNECNDNTGDYRDSKYNDRFIAKWMPTLNCPLCQEACTNFASLDDHFKACHPNEKTYVKCCKRKIKKRYILAEHVCIHIDPDKLTCKQCNILYATPSTLRKHNIRRHPKSKAALNYGPKPDKNLDAIVAQWKPNLECAICRKSYPSLTLLHRHFKLQHHNEAFHIFCCGRKLAMPNLIKSHAFRHLGGRAPNQTAANIAFSALDNSPSTTNASQPRYTGDTTTTTTTPPPDIRENSCNTDHSSMEYVNAVDISTGEMFNNTEESLSEIDSIRSEFCLDDEIPSTSNAIKTSPTKVASSSAPATNKTFISNNEFIAKWMPTLKCPLCQKACTNFPSLDHHFKECHPNEKSYVECCQRKLSSRYMLAEHVCVHMDPGRLSCKLCNIFFTSACGLRQHNIGRHPKSKAALNYDPKDNANLDAIVAKWKPNLECTICKEPSTSLTLLRRHFKRKHPDEAFHIFCCRRKWAVLGSIKSHALSHLTGAASIRMAVE